MGARRLFRAGQAGLTPRSCVTPPRRTFPDKYYCVLRKQVEATDGWIIGLFFTSEILYNFFHWSGKAHLLHLPVAQRIYRDKYEQ